MIKRVQFNKLVRKDIKKAFERAVKKTGLQENIVLETILAEWLRARGLKVKPVGLEDVKKPRRVGFVEGPIYLELVV